MQLQVKMPEKSTNILFTKKQTTNKVTPNITRGLEVGGTVRLMFSYTKHNNKG